MARGRGTGYGVRPRFDAAGARSTRRDNRRQPPADQNQTTMDVVLEKIFWKAEDSDYLIGAAIDHATGQEVIVKGHIDAAEGERVRVAEGRWRYDARYGWSFQVKKVDRSDPVDPGEVLRYLEGLEDVSPELAAAILATLGPECIGRLDGDPELLRTVKGAPPGEADSLAGRWVELRGRRRALSYLSSLDLSDALASRLVSFYGAEVIEIMKTDPYRITEVPKVSFRLADRVARNAGVPLDDPKRLAAGTEYALAEAEDDGHSYMERGRLIHRCYGVLGLGPAVSNKAMQDALDDMLRRERLIAETVGSEERIYTAEMFRIETSIYRHLQGRLQLAPHGRSAPARPPVREGAFAPTDEQWQAVSSASTERLSLLTGGPGVGKTATLEAMVDALDRQGVSYVLAAPTGKAAKRMSESTGRPASTLHRLIGYEALESTDTDSAVEPIKAQTVIIDESSMLSVRMAERVLAHCGPDTNVVLVGDPDQLPPVGAGSVFLDLLESDRVPTTRLTKVFRQAEDSLLLINARRVRAGQEPFWDAASAEAALGHPVRADWEFVDTDDAKAAAAKAIELAESRPAESTLLLSPTRDGDAGVHALNDRMQELRNPKGTSIGSRDKRELRVGDAILITQNDSRLKIVNGDIGRITAFDAEEKTVTFDLDEGSRTMNAAHLLEVSQLGYTLTVHKSQGSQAPHVVAPLTLGSGQRMLSRALVYTAWTRAQESCTVVGSRDALRAALSNDGSQRNTTLDLRIASIAKRLELRAARAASSMKAAMAARRGPAPATVPQPTRPVPKRTMPDAEPAAPQRRGFKTTRRKP